MLSVYLQRISLYRNRSTKSSYRHGTKHGHNEGHGFNIFSFICSFWHHWLFCSRSPLWLVWSGTALTWIHSFLINRFQSIEIRKCFSKAVPLFCGVPQGSVLGPLLFTLYTTPISSLIYSHKLDHHLCADDTQVYISLSTVDTDLSLKQLGDCLSDISGWMTNNKFRLNANKTDFIIIATSRQTYSFLPYKNP